MVNRQMTQGKQQMRTTPPTHQLLHFIKIYSRTSAVSSTNFGSILIYLCKLRCWYLQYTTWASFFLMGGVLCVRTKQGRTSKYVLDKCITPGDKYFASCFFSLPGVVSSGSVRGICWWWWAIQFFEFCSADHQRLFLVCGWFSLWRR